MSSDEMMHDLNDLAIHCEGAARGMQQTIDRLMEKGCPADTLAKSESNRDEWKRWGIASREGMRRIADAETASRLRGLGFG